MCGPKGNPKPLEIVSCRYISCEWSGMSNLQTVCRAALPPEVSVEATGIPRERVAMSAALRAMLPEHCVQKRLAEFAVGRYCASRALKRLGAPDTALEIADNRAPLAPAGFALSISHDDTHAIAVAAHASQCGGLGIDLTADEGLGSEVMELVCRPDELARRPAGLSEPVFGKQLFSIKESVYKACTVDVQASLDWLQIDVTLCGESGFNAALHTEDGAMCTVSGLSQRAFDKWISFATTR